jgi:hypothetical protein
MAVRYQSGQFANIVAIQIQFQFQFQPLVVEAAVGSMYSTTRARRLTPSPIGGENTYVHVDPDRVSGFGRTFRNGMRRPYESGWGGRP